MSAPPACDDVVPVIKIIPGCRALLGADSGYLDPCWYVRLSVRLSAQLSSSLMMVSEGE